MINMYIYTVSYMLWIIHLEFQRIGPQLIRFSNLCYGRGTVLPLHYNGLNSCLKYPNKTAVIEFDTPESVYWPDGHVPTKNFTPIFRRTYFGPAVSSILSG